MNYSELIQTYFERSSALQWYWTIYVIVIVAVLGFSTFRQRPDVVTTVLITVLFVCFAYKNLGAIEATATEREAILSLIKDHPADGSNAADVERARDVLEPALPPYDIAGARYFHMACAFLTVLFLGVAEYRRKNTEVRS